MAPTHGGGALVSVTDHHHWQLLSGDHLHHGLLKQLYKDPSFRAAFREELRNPGAFSGAWHLISVNVVKNPSMLVLEGKSVEEIARSRGKDPLDTFFDLALEDNLDLRYNVIRTEVPTELLDDSRVMIGESDGGAHVDQFCTAGYCTDMIGTWVRDKKVLSLERAIARMTAEPADFFGIHDRGRLIPGAAADIAIFDYDRIACLPAEAVYDLPGGGRRMIVKPQGVEYVVVNGGVIFEGDRPTGERPGGVLRS
jgi:N-acyl-D-aspartate/D-glutamate deacylase